jgi:hypothetical protein
VIAAIYARSGVRVTFRLRTLTVAGHVLLVAICLWAVESASGGDPVTIRVLDPQGLEAGILSFPDRDDVGTGTFETNIPPGALATDPFVRVAAAPRRWGRPTVTICLGVTWATPWCPCCSAPSRAPS